MGSSLGHLYYELHAAENPNAETLIFAHGLGLSLHDWYYILPYLSDYHCLLFDLRGHGQTTGTLQSESWSDVVDDVYHLVEYCQIEHFHFIGYGLGAYIAPQLAVHPQLQSRMKSATLLSAMFQMDSNVSKELQWRYDHFEQLGDMMAENIVWQPTIVKKAKIRQSFTETDRESYFRFLKLIVTTTKLDDLARFSCPLALMIGEYDVLSSPSIAFLSRSIVPSIKLHYINDAGHHLPYDQPQVVAQYIRDFLHKVAHNKLVFVAQRDIVTLMQQNLIAPKTSLSIHVLQSFTVTVNKRAIDVNWERRKMQSILLALALFKKVTRRQLQMWLWPEATTKQAQGSLRVALQSLKATFGSQFDELFNVTPTSIAIAVPYESDLLTVTNLINSWTNEQNGARKLAIAEQLLHSDVLPFLQTNGEEALVEWQNQMELKLIQMFQYSSSYYKDVDKNVARYYETQLTLLYGEKQVSSR